LLPDKANSHKINPVASHPRVVNLSRRRKTSVKKKNFCQEEKLLSRRKTSVKKKNFCQKIWVMFLLLIPPKTPFYLSQI
jgi:hypothetical protein